jgi:GTPase SAR1 family protein/polyhydroxyalkanoate synthesis regulator phasin
MSFLDDRIKGFRLQLGEVLKSLHEFTQRINHEEMVRVASDLRDGLHDPFLFVIVGEVKVGKSSFVNALLNSKEEICKVAPQPMTDTIQVIRYGEEVSETVVNPYLKHLTHPANILKEVAVVDTPGTNTIIEKHQEITEDYIPNSDLVVFVFEAKNPYRQSAWDFFDFIKEEWHKKLIFILQQKDLMSEEDLKTNLEGVREFANKKGVADPTIFAVSAKLELEDKVDASGFKPLREYIKSTITGGKAPLLKLLSKVNTSEQVLNRLGSAIADRKEQWESDKAFREDIMSSLDEQQSTANKKVAHLVENILDSYDHTTLQTKNKLADGLSFLTILRRSFTSIFDKTQDPKSWLSELAVGLEKDLNIKMKEKLARGVKDISESLQQMAQIAQLKIQHSETILKDDHDVFSSIADKRARILLELQEAFDHFLNESKNFYPKDMLEGGSKLSPNVATGTSIAVLGAILTAITQGAIFDITGGVLAAIGLTFAGASLSFQRRKLIKRFNEEVVKGRAQLQEQVQDRLRSYISDIRERIDGHFSKLDAHLKTEENEISLLESTSGNIHSKLTALEKEIQSQYDA